LVVDSDHLHARFDEALASGDTSASLEALARSMKTEGMGQLALYRRLAGFLSQIHSDDPRHRPVVEVMDLVWGEPWARGRSLFDRPLDEAAAIEAGSLVYTVNEVVAALKRLDGRFVRISGELILRMEQNAIWHDPPSERRPGQESSLWARYDARCALRPSPGFERRPIAEWPGTGANREFALWFHEEFDGRIVSAVAAVDARVKGHLGSWPGGLQLLSIARAD
jgi:hypothetical protein